jgi:hypothetical protein
VVLVAFLRVGVGGASYRRLSFRAALEPAGCIAQHEADDHRNAEPHCKDCHGAPFRVRASIIVVRFPNILHHQFNVDNAGSPRLRPIASARPLASGSGANGLPHCGPEIPPSRDGSTEFEQDAEPFLEATHVPSPADAVPSSKRAFGLKE